MDFTFVATLSLFLIYSETINQSWKDRLLNNLHTFSN